MVPRYPYYDMYFYSPEALLNDEFTPRYKKLGIRVSSPIPPTVC